MGLKLNTDKLKNKTQTNQPVKNTVSKGFKLSASSDKKYDLDQIIYKIRRDNADYPLLVQIDYTNLNNKQFVQLMTKYVLDKFNVAYNENNFDDYVVIAQVPNFELELEQMCNKYYKIYYQYYGALNEGSISIDTVFEKITLARDDYEQYLLSNPGVLNTVSYQVDGDNKPKFLVEEGTVEPLENEEDARSVLDLIEELQETKQDKLQSGINIKTINGQSIIGTGDITIVGGADGDSTISSASTTIGDIIVEHIYYAGHPVIVDYAIGDEYGNNISETYLTKADYESNKAFYKAGRNIIIDTDYTIHANIPERISELENDANYLTTTLADLKYVSDDKLQEAIAESKIYSDNLIKNIIDGAPEIFDSFGDVYKYIVSNEDNLKNIKDTIIDVQNILDDKQDKLQSGVNIKTINGIDILGQGNITVSGDGSTIEANPINVATERLNKVKIDGVTYDVSSDVTTLIGRVDSLEQTKQNKLTAGQNIFIDQTSGTISATLPDIVNAEKISLSDFIKINLTSDDISCGILFRAASKTEIDSETFQKIYTGNVVISINTSNFILDYPLIGSMSPIIFTIKNNVGSSVVVFNNHLIEDDNNVGFACIITRNGITQLFAIDLSVAKNQSVDVDLSNYYSKKETDSLLSNLRNYVDDKVSSGGSSGSLKAEWSDGVLTITEPFELKTTELDGVVTIL